MKEYREIDLLFQEVIESLKDEKLANRERKINFFIDTMASHCNAYHTYLDYCLDPKKDVNLFKKLLSIQILGKVIIYSDNRITDYLLQTLRDKTNLELYLGSNMANSKITSYLSVLTTLLGGFTLGFFSVRRFGGIAGCIAGGVVGTYATYKYAQMDVQHLDKAELRKYAAHSLQNRKLSTIAILTALKERVEDNYEHQSVKDAAQMAIDQFQQQKESSQLKF
jgi:hypothetical protein